MSTTHRPATPAVVSVVREALERLVFRSRPSQRHACSMGPEPEAGVDSGIVLVGRDAERLALDRLCESLGGDARAVVLAGPAGIGKSAIWQYGVSQLRSLARVLRCQPTEIGHRLSYLALTDLLESVMDHVDALDSPLQTSLRDALRLEAGAGSAEPFAVEVAVTEVFRRLLDRPLVLAIDDAHWLDAGSARVLGFAVRRLSEAPIGILATQRGPGMPEFVRAALSSDRVEVSAVEPLDLDEVDRLIQHHLGVALRRATVAAVYQTSGGNPLYALELARAALRPQARQALVTGRDLPPSQRDLIGHRVTAVGNGAMQALLVVASAAEPTLELITRVLGPSGAAGLQPAIDARLVEQTRGRLRFTHPLLAAAVYEAADPARRRRIQLILARLAADPEEKGRLLADAVQLPDADAAQTVEEAARAAASRGLPASAGLLAERAAELTPSSASEEWARRLLAAADYYWAAGDDHGCLAHLQTLDAALPPGPGHAAVVRRLARRTALTESFAAARSQLRDGIAEADDDAVVQATLHRDLAVAYLRDGDVQASAQLVVEAVSLARRVGDSDLIEDTETVELLRTVIADPGGDALTLTDRLISLSRHDSGDHWLPSGSRLVLIGAMLKWIDRFDEAREVLTRAWRTRWDRQEDGLLLAPLLQLTELECWAGRYDEADRLGSIAETTERRNPGGSALKPIRPYLAAIVAARRGDLETATALATEALALATSTADRRSQLRTTALLGYITLTSDRHSEAVKHLARVEDMQARLGYAHPGIVRSTADLIEALTAVGEIGRATSRLDEFTRRATLARSAWGSATALRCRGLLLLARDDKQGAVDALTHAVTRSRSQPDPMETVRSCLALGQALRHDRRRVRARPLLQEAIDLSAAIGAVGWHTKAVAELARCGKTSASPTGVHAGRTVAGQVLTPMQTTIAELVASGKGNRQIAAQLYISQKTVEAHLSAIYRQLGLRNRTELATYVHDRTLEGRESPDARSPGVN
jgi:DNA-binding NarL/FixJ family response regulator